MKQNIAVIGGDSRYLEMIRRLKTVENASILLIGFDQLEQGFTSLKQVDMQEVRPDEIDVAILPITGTDAVGNVETVFSDKQICLTREWFQSLKKNTIIFTGMSNSYLDEITKSNKLKLIPLLNHDDVAIYNSIPTAEGAIMMAIEHTDYTIHGSNVLVTGFGRVGHTVSNKFSALGANVHVAADSLHDLARVSEMGLTAIPIQRLSSSVENCDLLINTIPAPVVNQDVIEKLPAHTVIIDLASKPGGTDFTFATKRGIKAILAKSLPGVVAPKTAGQILADVISQLLEEGGS